MTELQWGIALAALATFLLRVGPILLLSRIEIPTLLKDWLGFVPAAILAAIIVVELMSKPELSPSGWSLSLLAALAAAAAGAATRSLFVTVAAGVGAFLALQALLT